MENAEEVTTVDLNAGVVSYNENRFYKAIHRYMRATLFDFFRKMFLRAMEDAKLDPMLNTNLLYINRLNKISLWPEAVIRSTTKALEEYGESAFPQFSLRKIVRKLLASQLCMQAASENKACSNRIQINDIHIQELIFDMLKSSGKDLANAPSLFVSERGRSFVKREKLFDYVFERSIRNALTDFVERYIYRIETGVLENPLVPIPAVEAPKEEQRDDEEEGGFKEVFGVGEENANPFVQQENDEGGEVNPFANGDEVDEREVEGEIRSGPMNRDERGGGEDLSSSDREKVANDWEKEYTDDDEDDDKMIDDEPVDPRKIHFNEKVEVAEFKKENVKGILKPYDAPLKQGVYYDPKDKKYH